MTKESSKMKHHWLSNDSVKWLDNQIIDTGFLSVSLIIRGLDNQAQMLNNKLNRF
jgi:hypothetical protein